MRPGGPDETDPRGGLIPPPMRGGRGSPGTQKKRSKIIFETHASGDPQKEVLLDISLLLSPNTNKVGKSCGSPREWGKGTGGGSGGRGLGGGGRWWRIAWVDSYWGEWLGGGMDGY